MALLKRIGGWSYLVAALGLAAVPLAGLLLAFGSLSAIRAYWTAAIGASTFTGFASLAVWRQAAPGAPGGPEDKTALPLWPWYVHKWSFNGAGALVGWFALRLVYSHVSTAQPVTTTTFALGLVALLGVSGWLPSTVVGISGALRKIADKATEALLK